MLVTPVESETTKEHTEQAWINLDHLKDQWAMEDNTRQHSQVMVKEAVRLQEAAKSQEVVRYQAREAVK